jgi:hypothetical protein
MLFIFSIPVLIRHQRLLKTVVFLHRCLMHAVLLLSWNLSVSGVFQELVQLCLFGSITNGAMTLSSMPVSIMKHKKIKRMLNSESGFIMLSVVFLLLCWRSEYLFLCWMLLFWVFWWWVSLFWLFRMLSFQGTFCSLPLLWMFMLNVIILSVVMLNFIMLNVAIECHHDEYRYSDCHYAECHCSECLNAECHYSECS